MIVLPITLTIAAAAALLNIWIATRVGTLRRRHKIAIGHGDNAALTARMRAHSNFIEYAPLFLILLGLIELAEGSEAWLWAVGALFILGRILHVFGMDRQTVNRLRTVGTIVTLLCLFGLAAYAIAIPYLHRVRTPPIGFAAAPAQGTAQAPASTLSPTNGLLRRS